MSADEYDHVDPRVRSTNPDLWRRYGRNSFPLEQLQQTKFLLGVFKNYVWLTKKRVLVNKPILIQKQADGTGKVYTNVKAGVYDYAIGHEDKGERGIHILNENAAVTIPFGNTSMKVWFTHYAYAFPYFMNDKLASVLLKRLAQKWLAIQQNFRAAQVAGFSKLIWALLIGGAIMIAAYFFFNRGDPSGAAQPVIIAAENLSQYIVKQ